MTDRSGHPPRLGVDLRAGERVSPLELFFDLVFVLAITQTTALMAKDPSWTGIVRALVVLSLLWWAWVGYAWLTSVVDPDDGRVRLVIFGAMAALLVAALCVPDAFGDLGLTFAISYAVVRAAHIALFVLASTEDAGLRHSVLGFAVSTTIGVAALVAGSFLDGDSQLAAWAAALAFDMAGPLVIDTQGWRLAPGHFAERHGLIVIVALGESIVAIGVGAEAGVDGGVIAAAAFGIAVACAFWWAYFDVTAVAAAQRLAEGDVVKSRNELARDAYSYLHLPMISAVVLVAFGLKTTLSHVDEPLEWQAAVALTGGAALYLLSLVLLKRRSLGTVTKSRIVGAAVLASLIPLAHRVDAVVTVAIVASVLWALMGFELVRYHEARQHIRLADQRRTTGAQSTT